MTSFLNQDLSEAEIERLAARLAAYPSALSLEEVDGLFCALVAGPGLILPSEYLPLILGSEPGGPLAFNEAGDVQDTLALLMRYWNAIARHFEEDTVHLAYLEQSGVDGIPGRAWARGYMRGTRLAPEGWGRIFQDPSEGLLLTIPIVAGEVDPAWPKEPLTEARSEELIKEMLAGAARAYRYFKDDRIEQARMAAEAHSRPYERSGPKIGRNDPCPCGSGKKYKRCCGGSGSRNGSVH
jgi:uncharacterized protein